MRASANELIDGRSAVKGTRALRARPYSVARRGRPSALNRDHIVRRGRKMSRERNRPLPVSATRCATRVGCIDRGEFQTALTRIGVSDRSVEPGEIPVRKTFLSCRISLLEAALRHFHMTTAPDCHPGKQHAIKRIFETEMAHGPSAGCTSFAGSLYRCLYFRTWRITFLELSLCPIAGLREVKCQAAFEEGGRPRIPSNAGIVRLSA